MDHEIATPDRLDTLSEPERIAAARIAEYLAGSKQDSHLGSHVLKQAIDDNVTAFDVTAAYRALRAGGYLDRTEVRPHQLSLTEAGEELYTSGQLG